MKAEKSFETFLDNLRIADPDKLHSRRRIITKILNRRYWDSDSGTDHSLLVGSIGRGTAIEGASDLDIVMALPRSVKRRLDEHVGSGQSALLQEVRSALKTTYSSTEIRGDGQVVVVGMKDLTVEVLPAFEKRDGRFLFPNTRDGGAWRTTDPRAEIDAVNDLDEASGGNLKRICKMARAWRDASGVALSGLLIDTLAYNFVLASPRWREVDLALFDHLMDAFFDYLGTRDPEQEYWLAPGSRQYVLNKGPFTRRAKAAHRKCREAIRKDESAEASDIWRDIFGPKFPSAAQLQPARQTTRPRPRYTDTEECIEDVVPVAIRGSVSIDCEVAQPGFRTCRLSEILRQRWPLKRGRRLRFFITSCSIRRPYLVKWKVRNVGPEAERRNEIRGQILDDLGGEERIENTKFQGPHYVECYLVQNGVCVARGRIDVPIITGA